MAADSPFWDISFPVALTACMVMALCLAASQTITQSSQPLQRSMNTSATILFELRSRQLASGQYMMHSRHPFLATHFSSMTWATLYMRGDSFSLVKPQRQDCRLAAHTYSSRPTHWRFHRPLAQLPGFWPATFPSWRTSS